MDDAGVVRPLQRAADLTEDARRVRKRDARGPVEARVEGLAGEELHHHVRPLVVGHPVVVDLDGVLALQGGGGARLGVEARARLLAPPVLGVDELDGHPRPQRDVASFPHRAHAAAADEPEHLVLAGDESTGRSRLRIHPGCPLLH